MSKPCQPKTGLPCSCKRGQERDNCPACEGTGWQIDFRAIRAATVQTNYNMELPCVHVAEYDAAAEWSAKRGLKGLKGDALPLNMASDGALKYIQADPEAFRERVKQFAYALAMEKVESKL